MYSINFSYISSKFNTFGTVFATPLVDVQYIIHVVLKRSCTNLRSDRYERDRWSVLSYILLFSVSLIWETFRFTVPHCHLQVHYWSNCEDWKMKWTRRVQEHEWFISKDNSAFLRELYDVRGFFPNWFFFAGISIFILNFAKRISEAAIGGAGRAATCFAC